MKSGTRALVAGNACLKTSNDQPSEPAKIFAANDLLLWHIRELIRFIRRVRTSHAARQLFRPVRSTRLMVLRCTVRADLTRQILPELSGNLGSLNLNSLAIEVDIIAVEFWMAAHRGVEIDGRNFLRGHDFCGDGIASRNPFVRVRHVRIVGSAFAIAQWSCGCPDQLGFRRVSPNGLDKFGQRLPILHLTVLPAVHAVVELDHFELRCVQDQFDFLQ